MRRAWPVLASISLALAVALPPPSAESTPDASAPAAGAENPCAQGKRTGRFTLRLRSGGRARTALVNVPPGASASSPRPVMVALHGAGGWGEFMERGTGLTPLANRAGMISVYPDANGKYWRLNGVGEEGRADVVFMRDLLDRVERVTCADHSRVYVTGGSNGAGLVARIGCELSDRVAAVAPVAGGYYRLPACTPDRPVSVLEVHGTADQSVPYRGKYGEGSVQSFLAQWQRFDRCSGKVAWRRVAAHVLRSDWTECASGTQVAHIKIFGGHHAWQGTPIGGDDDYIHLSTQHQVIAFFRGKRLATP